MKTVKQYFYAFDIPLKSFLFANNCRHRVFCAISSVNDVANVKQKTYWVHVVQNKNNFQWCLN